MARSPAVIALLGSSIGSEGSGVLDGSVSLATALRDLGEVLVAANCEQALEQLARVQPVTALIVNVPETARAVYALERIRDQDPLLPVLALVDASADRARILQLKCELCELPVNVRQLRNFVLRAQAFQRVQAAWRAWLVEYGAKTYALSSRAIGLLAHAVNNAAPALLMAELGVSHHTLFAQMTRLLNPHGAATELSRADALLQRLLANTSLREWDRQRQDDVSAVIPGKPELRH